MRVFAEAFAIVRLDLSIAARGLWDFLGERSAATKTLILVAVVVFLHALALAAALRMGDNAETLAIAARVGALFVLPWTVANAMMKMSRLLFQRGDLDLVLASPADARALLAARLAAQAVDSVASVGFILLPFANANVFLGRWRWLALYPTLAGAGALGASLGFVIALALLFALGPRRARICSQIVASVVGASAVLVAQALALLPDAWRDRLQAAFAASPRDAETWRRLIETPARAALGEPAALAAWLAAALAAFALVVVFGAKPFSRAALASAGAPGGHASLDRRPTFRTGLGPTMRAKEHRLLWRDPWLVSQMLMQALYTFPIGIVLWRHGGVTGTPAVAFGPMLVVISGQLAGSLAWLALSAEDAPEFLASAPATRGELDRAKLAAILTPVAIFIAPPLAALTWATPWGGLTAALGAAGAAASGALLMLWRQAPARRSLVLRRHSQSKLVALGEHWLALLWAAATAIAAIGSFAFALPVGLAALTLWAIRPRTPVRSAPKLKDAAGAAFP